MPTDMNDEAIPSMSYFDMAMKTLEQQPELYDNWKREGLTKAQVTLSFTAVIDVDKLRPVLAAYRLTHPMTVKASVLNIPNPPSAGQMRSGMGMAGLNGVGGALRPYALDTEQRQRDLADFRARLAAAAAGTVVEYAEPEQNKPDRRKSLRKLFGLGL